MKRYQWEWATWGEWLGGERMLFPVLPEPLAERLLRRAGRCVDDGCTGSAEKCATCCGRGGRHV